MRIKNEVTLSLKLLQEVLTATLDLEDVRSYRAEISSRNLSVSALVDTHVGYWSRTQKPLFFFL